MSRNAKDIYLNIKDTKAAEEFLQQFNIQHNLPSNNQSRKITSAITSHDLQQLFTNSGIKTEDLQPDQNTIEISSNSIKDTKIADFFSKDAAIKISLDLKAINNLKDFFEKDAMDNDWIKIFENPELLNIANTLYLLKRIATREIIDLLYLHQIIKGKDQFKLKKHGIIFDTNNQWHKDGDEIINHLLKGQNSLGPKLLDTHIPSLKLLLSASPSRFKVFLITTTGKYPREPFTHRDVSWQGENYLLHHIYELGIIQTIIFEGEFCLLHLSFSFKELINQLKFKNPRKLKLTQKMIPIRQMEAADDENPKRLGNVGLSRKKLHDVNNPTPWLLTIHDEYHDELLSAMPDYFHDILKFLKITVRQLTKVKMSNEIWTLTIDKGYTWFYKNHLSVNYQETSPEKITEIFCKSILTNEGIRKYYFSEDLVSQASPQPSVFCLIFLLSLLQNPNKWHEVGIQGEFLTDLFQVYYQQLQSIFAEIKSDDITLQILKCQIYCWCWRDSSRDPETYLPKVLERISDKQLLKFDKFIENDLQTKDFSNTNRLNLSLNDKKLDPVQECLIVVSNVCRARFDFFKSSGSKNLDNEKKRSITVLSPLSIIKSVP